MGKKRTRARGAAVVEYALCVMVVVAGTAAAKKLCGLHGRAAADVAGYVLDTAAADAARASDDGAAGDGDGDEAADGPTLGGGAGTGRRGSATPPPSASGVRVSATLP